MARTDTLGNFLTDVADAIRAKTGSSDTIQASSFDIAIDNIPSGGGVDFSYMFANNNFETLEFSPNGQIQTATNMEGMLMNCSNLQYADVGNIDTIYCTNFSHFCQDCASLTELPYMIYDSATTLEEMCFGCSSLTTFEIGTGSGNPFVITNMSGTFRDCSSLVDAYNESDWAEYNTNLIFDTSNVEDMSLMFYGCSLLQNVSQFNTSSVLNMNEMFTGCPNLTNQSLDNILGMCAGVSANYTEQKTLGAVGIETTDYPDTDFTQLSNYQAFINAGWTLS